jgi:hypothetical protein
MIKEPKIIYWNHLSYVVQLKTINLIEVLMSSQKEPEIKTALVAAINELKMWANVVDTVAPLELGDEDIIEEEIIDDEPYVVKTKKWVH